MSKLKLEDIRLGQELYIDDNKITVKAINDSGMIMYKYMRGNSEYINSINYSYLSLTKPKKLVLKEMYSIIYNEINWSKRFSLDGILYESFEKAQKACDKPDMIPCKVIWEVEE